MVQQVLCIERSKTKFTFLEVNNYKSINKIFIYKVVQI
jgi:hypothetical protein